MNLWENANKERLRILDKSLISVEEANDILANPITRVDEELVKKAIDILKG